MRAALTCLVVVTAPCLAVTARAAGGPDTSYGRIDGDISATAGLGATFGPRGARAAADLRLHYLWTAGIFATHEDGPLLGSPAEPLRAFACGVDLRPLFLARWLQGLHSGNGTLDLAIDSIGVELGAVFVEPRGAAFGSRPGLQAGLGFAVPILPQATGPLIGVHGGARWSDGSLAGRDIESASDRALYLVVTLGWQQVFGAHIVDLGDRAPQ